MMLDSIHCVNSDKMDKFEFTKHYSLDNSKVRHAHFKVTRHLRTLKVCVPNATTLLEETCLITESTVTEKHVENLTVIAYYRLSEFCSLICSIIEASGISEFQKLPAEFYHS